VDAKQPFDIDTVLGRVEAAVHPLPKAALFQLAEEGFGGPFEQLLACMISIRTRDETTVVCARRLFSLGRTPAELAALSSETIDRAIGEATFHEPKSRQIATIARQVVDEFGGELPCEPEVLQGFRGVGPKCANLVLGIACGKLGIGVDIHVHRITNRWGYVQANTPEKTMAALETRLPRRYWVDINRLLVPFGKHICTGTRPRCSSCVVLEMCRQVGVTEHR
jgi:endonuclease-3